MIASRKLWNWLALVCVLSFAALGWVGTEIYLHAPPIPERVQSDSGDVLFDAGEIQRGQEAWPAAGGQQMGSVWGHGSYLAPDWSADWLHREALALREIWAGREQGASYAELDPDTRAALDARLERTMRANGHDPERNTLVLDDDRAAAVREVAAHYAGLFGSDPALDALREQYALMPESLRDPLDRRALTAFFFWSAWSAAADRPGESGLSYTSNWPHEPLVGNTPTASLGIWSIASVILMLGAIAGMILFHARHADADPTPPKADPLIDLKPTPSMLATRKYFFVVIGLILAQVGMGVITAHYGRRAQLLRHPAGGRTAVHREPHHPHPVRSAVDRHRVAGDRALHRTGDLGPRAEVPETRREPAVLRAAVHRRRLHRHGLDR